MKGKVRVRGERLYVQVEPLDLDQKPLDLDQKPLDPDQKPLDPDQKSLDPDQKPLDPDQKPLDPDQKSLDLDQKSLDLNVEALWETSARSPSSAIRLSSRQSAFPGSGGPCRSSGGFAGRTCPSPRSASGGNPRHSQPSESETPVPKSAPRPLL